LGFGDFLGKETSEKIVNGGREECESEIGEKSRGNAMVHDVGEREEEKRAGSLWKLCLPSSSEL